MDYEVCETPSDSGPSMFSLCRHLVYCVCDLLMEFLIPESSDESFRRSLLNSLSNYSAREAHSL